MPEFLSIVPPYPLFFAQDGERIFQKNEGQWDFSLQEDDAGLHLELSVDVGKFLDTSLIRVRTSPISHETNKHTPPFLVHLISTER